ncbi:MAG: pyridoxal-phosphate dependent enzyme, partial [Actinobacteria bacterium]|nr:pyridoxal-phosphate dependent enzyme [Actinomycetota bacterium]
MRYHSILDAIGNTPLVEVPKLSPVGNVRIWTKLEGQNPTGSVKDRVALALVESG